MKMKNSAVIMMLILTVAAAPSFAAEKQPASGQRYLSRGEMAVMMSATDFMKDKIGSLLNFAVGYNLVSLNRLTMAPIIRFIKADPDRVPPDGRTPFNLYVSVDDPGGLAEILSVKADVSSLGKLSSISLVDNGLWGDAKSNDGIYTLQTSTSTRVWPGNKELPVSVVNKKGWLSVAKTNVTIENIPSIINAEATPYSVAADGSSVVRLTARVIDPSGPENISQVAADLSAIGGRSFAVLHNDGKNGDLSAADDLFSLEMVPQAGVPAGVKKMPVWARNRSGAVARGQITVNIVK